MSSNEQAFTGRVVWDEIHEHLDQTVACFTEAQYAWFESVWGLLESRRLTHYTSTEEHFVVLMRCAAISWLLQTAESILDESGDPEISTLVTALCLSLRRTDDHDEDDDFFVDTFPDLPVKIAEKAQDELEVAYKRVVSVLRDAFPSESDLLCFLVYARYQDLAGRIPLPRLDEGSGGEVSLAPWQQERMTAWIKGGMRGHPYV